MSLDQPTQDSVENIVLDYMQANRSFTSVDIANIAKNQGLFARNRDVAEWLRSNAIAVAHEYGHLYNQTLIEVDSKVAGRTLAYLYHHMNTASSEYLDRDQNPQPYRVPARAASVVLNAFAGSQPPPLPGAATPNQSTTSRSGGHDGWQRQRRDKNGRWC